MNTSVIQGAELWLAVLCGFGLLLVGVGLGYFIRINRSSVSPVQPAGDHRHQTHRVAIKQNPSRLFIAQFPLAHQPIVRPIGKRWRFFRFFFSTSVRFQLRFLTSFVARWSSTAIESSTVVTTVLF